MGRSPTILKELANNLSKQLDEVVHFGALVPWANIAMESELPYIFPKEVVWHFARLVPPSRSTAIDDDFLSGMIQAIPQTSYQFKHLPLNLIAFGCTSASFCFPSELTQSAKQNFLSIPFISAYQAIKQVIDYYEANQIVLFTPYEESITHQETQTFESQGIKVLRSISLGYSDDIGKISSDEIVKTIKGYDIGSPDAIVLSCTALQTLDAIKQLEQHYHVPVISSNSALALASVLLYINQ